MHERDARLRAGYALEDTPCEPRRSAYTDDIDGDAAYDRAMERWLAYLEMTTGGDVEDSMEEGDVIDSLLMLVDELVRLHNAGWIDLERWPIVNGIVERVTEIYGMEVE